MFNLQEWHQNTQNCKSLFRKSLLFIKNIHSGNKNYKNFLYTKKTGIIYITLATNITGLGFSLKK